MTYLFLGLAAFPLFFLYDINSIIFKRKVLQGCFFIGIMLLILSTGGMIAASWSQMEFNVLRIILSGILALFFFLLLIYTLFFALPFQETYIQSQGLPKVCKKGVYALCRHPGVLWFAGFYLFLGLTFMMPLLLAAGILFSLLNLLYVMFQDRWTFMKSFEDYGEYKKSTPFLLPNYESIKSCIHTLHEERRR
ncbi:hypothetical protein [Sinanaerobacter chloroacetimidivorans]|jgi:protein-S-isoprenylcysteine O-methyltransferase Ste14|uniref:Protein-S-isoprenylcysteine O-methyltransferase Ste14 n=1 Tax=Sinanaerobacter chloroacetimidivorans TaxID=2818044 RepID=A0A8J8B232_9FIRM|nr:hypothetical protein [Sinanaerobacter chloroacetimidivorans]MBR0598869.1 hypothetical protein [Sinanaerobacter chloroacetimidivorans]